MRRAIANSTRPRDDGCSSPGAAETSSHTPIPSRAAETRRNRLLSLVSVPVVYKGRFGWEPDGDTVHDRDGDLVQDESLSEIVIIDAPGHPNLPPTPNFPTTRYLLPAGEVPRMGRSRDRRQVVCSVWLRGLACSHARQV